MSNPHPLSPHEAAQLLGWYAQMGVSEGLDEAPHDRFAESALPEPARPAVARTAVATGRPLSGGGQASPGSIRPAPERGATAGSTPARPAPAAMVAPDLAAENARAAANAATTLDELKAALAAFEGCALKALAKNLVFADGNPAAKIMLVGEAPGADEDRLGLPFVGRSGQLLDRMLASIGLLRERDVYITNLLPWRPPGNRTPTPQEVAACMPFTQRHIQLVNPDILLCIGAPSALALLGYTGILASRGKWSPFTVGDRQIRAMAMLHPAYLLRRPLEKRLAWRDLQSLKVAIDGGG